MSEDLADTKPVADPEGLDPRRRRTAEALLRAAERELATQPLAEVTVGEIGRRAGVAVGSIYNNFGSKAALYAAVVDRALDVDREYMDRAYTPDRSPLEQLRAAGEQYLRFYLERPEFFRMLAFPPESGRFPAAAETSRRLARRVDAQNARMVGALRRGIAEGSIRAVDPEATATVLWAGWSGIISLAWRPDELRRASEELAPLLEQATAIVLDGLRA